MGFPDHTNTIFNRTINFVLRRRREEDFAKAVEKSEPPKWSPLRWHQEMYLPRCNREGGVGWGGVGWSGVEKERERW